MAVHLHFVEQGSPEWDAARVEMYTGSNAEKLLGQIGVREYAKARASDFKGNFHTMRGHLLEDEALELYEAIRGVKIIRDENGLKVGYVTNDKYPGCLYSPDSMTLDGLQEVKCFSLVEHMKLVKGDIPLKIMAQIMYGLTITGRKWVDLIAYNPKAERLEDKFVVHRFTRRRAIIANFHRILTSLNNTNVKRITV